MSTREPQPPSSSAGGPGDGPQPSLQPTTPAHLVICALVTAALAWLLISRWYADIPNLNYLPGVTLAALAVLEGIAARNTKNRIDRKPGTERINPLLVARFAVLAKASSLVGAGFAGAYGGVAAWALAERGQLVVAQQNLAPALAGLVGALALAAAALWLERSCRVPERPDDDPDGDKNDRP